MIQIFDHKQGCSLLPSIMATISLIALGFFASPSQGAVIMGVTIEDVSSELAAGSFDRLSDYLVDGSGFDEINGFHANTPEQSMWLNVGASDPAASLAVITFDLGASYDLTSLAVWNYNEVQNGNTDRGADEVELLLASSESGAFTSLGTFNFSPGPGLTNRNFRQDIDLSSFTAADNARLVRFNILSNHGDGDDFVGLSEVLFDGIAVPEPGRTALLTLGFFGIAARRRRKA